MTQASYQLVLHKLPLEATAEHARLSKVLSKDYQTNIVEIETSLENAPYVFKEGSSVAELLPDMSALVKDGAVALIVQNNGQAEALTKKGPSDHQEFEAFFRKYNAGLSKLLEKVKVSAVSDLLDALLKARRDNKRIFFIGNGGSAAISSHAATDFAKDRFKDSKYLFKVVSLADNTSLITATANDFGYENVFVKQLKCLLEKDDLLIAISSSGNSPNIIKAVEYAKECGAHTVGIVGFDGGKLAGAAEKNIHIPSKVGQYGYVEDISMVIIHMLSVFIYESDQQQVTGS